MAKLKNTPITQADLTEYLSGYSDFSFEVSVLRQLLDRGFTCVHSGSYDDPVSRKVREFDIRATTQFEIGLEMAKGVLRLAVECKNIRSNYPLLISCLPRREEEAFHEVIVSVNPERSSLNELETEYSDSWGLRVPSPRKPAKSLRVTGDESRYTPGGPVGKSCDQVGRAATSGEFQTGDAGIFEKWAQALASANDLVSRGADDGLELGLAVAVTIPILVVPDGMLWMAEFDDSGIMTLEPDQVDRCSYFVQREYRVQAGLTPFDHTITHLEFVTASGLEMLVDELTGNPALTLSMRSVTDHLNRLWGSANKRER